MQAYPADFYRQQSGKLLIEIKNFKRQLFFAAMARLACFLVILVSFYFVVTTAGSVAKALLIIAAAAFVFLLRAFFDLRTKKNIAEKLLFISENELGILHYKPNKFPDGAQVQHDSIFATDLDIRGPGSLYHHLNRTATQHGADALLKLLNNPFVDAAVIRERQDAVKVLASQPAVRHMIIARGLLREETDVNLGSIDGWIHEPGKLYRISWLNIIRFILPVLAIASFIYYLDTNQLGPVGACIVANWFCIAMFIKYIHRQHAVLGKKQSILLQYASILDEFYRCDTGNSSLLNNLAKVSATGRHEIKKLSKLTSLFDQRLNVLVNFFLNSFLMYDIHCMIALEKWKVKNSARFRQWVDTVGEIEVINSLATLAFNRPEWCYPTITVGSPAVRTTAIAHPLIPADEAVPNDIDAGKNEKLLLISGSNMSGKSTFLRTIGVNLLLAQCGAPVSASSFEFSPMHILTSIRINDSLQEHTSYFMAELKRLHAIIDFLESGRPALVLIDEVLRGTNSDDKTHGSEALIRRLIKTRCLAFFATHDLSLSRMAIDFPGQISNYCFESRIEMGELLFDYRLQEGVAKNKNATFLMQKMGIITS